LLAASADEKIGAAAISTLNFALGRELGRAAIEIARRARMPLHDVAFIGSHGHTFFHRPPRRTRRGQIASTLQLGESAVIAAETGVSVDLVATVTALTARSIADACRRLFFRAAPSLS
jgi:anhydro-N-acetylmuramic acid kinase